MRQLPFARARSRRKSSTTRLVRPYTLCGRKGASSMHREVVRLAVDGSGRAEHQRGDAGLAHHFRQRDGTAHVDVVVGERALLRLADRLEARAMDDGGDRMIVEDRAQRRGVAHVGGHRRYRPAGERLQPRQHGGRAVDEVVEDDRRVAGVRELDDDVRADVARPAGDEYRIPPYQCVWRMSAQRNKSYTTHARACVTITTARGAPRPRRPSPGSADGRGSGRGRGRSSPS